MISYITAEEAISTIKNGERIFVHGGAATPAKLISALCNRNNELKNVEIVHLHTEGPALYAQPEYSGSFTVNSFFTGANIRPYMNHSNVQYIPIFLSEIPALFRN